MQVLLALEQLEQNEALTSEVVVLPLSEEQLCESLRRSIYGTTHLTIGIGICGTEEMKCTICQWLRQKNWCPICKSSALRSRKSG
ncbi:hypothetical protein BHM03_00013043 [Ensete ventricosum]|nr:hypothetical protein BHM03_00013043 [Ensete ventricosum]